MLFYSTKPNLTGFLIDISFAALSTSLTQLLILLLGNFTMHFSKYFNFSLKNKIDSGCKKCNKI